MFPGKYLHIEMVYTEIPRFAKEIININIEGIVTTKVTENGNSETFYDELQKRKCI